MAVLPMELPTELIDVSASFSEVGFLRPALHRGSGGELDSQSQAILANLKRVFEPEYKKVCKLFGWNNALRISGFLAKITGLDRTTIHKHLGHLDAGEIHKPVSGRGGRKRARTPSPSLPRELAELPPVNIFGKADEEPIVRAPDEEPGPRAAQAVEEQEVEQLLCGLDYGLTLAFRSWWFYCCDMCQKVFSESGFCLARSFRNRRGKIYLGFILGWGESR